MCLAIFAAACGSPSDAKSGNDIGVGASPNDPEDPVSSTPDPDEPPAKGGAQIVEPKPGQADIRPIPWTHAAVSDDGLSVKVIWWSGVEPCNVLDSVKVDYSKDAVTITLFEGHTDTGEDVACIEIAMKKATIIQLDEPLGDRQLVDGAIE